MRFARNLLTAILWSSAALLPAAEVPISDFARHEQYLSVRISPNGDYLAATAVVGGQIVLELVNTADMRPRVLRPREGETLPATGGFRRTG